MADKRKTVNLLPEYFRSDKNSKFLSSTIDQFVQEPEIERINGYIGSKSTPNFNPELDLYIQDDVLLRRNYQLEPALVVRDSQKNIKDVIGYDDLINEITIQGGNTSNHNNLFKNQFYSYDPLIDWDKLTNYSFYYWLPSGPESILIENTSTSILSNMVGQSSFTMDNGYPVSNGMKLVFQENETLGEKSIVAGREYIVEGVGSSIVLVDLSTLEINKNFAEVFNERFDNTAFDTLPFDGDRRLPVTPEYITINKASRDLNPWTRYNRWFHEDVIKTTALINNKVPVYPVENKAKRPIVEFRSNIQLYNFGSKGIKNVELIDTDTLDPFNQINGTFGYYVDGILLEEGQTVIFNAATDESVRGKIYRIDFTVEESPKIQLIELIVPEDMNSVSINLGTQYSGTSWYFDQLSSTWKFSQQHLNLNDFPLFDLFDLNGVKFSDQEITNSFSGTRIFGYAIGTGNPDSVLGFPLKYRNNIGVGSYLFQNYFTTDTLILTINNVSSETTTAIGYLKIVDNQENEILLNVWNPAENYQIPIIENAVVDVNNTTTMIVSCFDKPFNTGTTIVSYVNGIKKDSSLEFGKEIKVNFTEPLKINDAVQYQLFSSNTPNLNGFYEPSLNLTNNPLNGPISYFTLSELTDHVSTMIPKISNFDGIYPGKSNLRDIFNYSKFGTRLIINSTPLAFSQMFLGIKENNVVDSIRTVGNLYNQFKMSLIDYSSKIESQLTPSEALDIVLKYLNRYKTSDSLFYRSDMVPYGEDKIVNEYTASIVPSTIYPISNNFDISKLSFNSLLIYVNNLQLTHGTDYIIDSIDSQVQILYPLTLGDVIKICFYRNTIGSFVPPTPSKLGIYPKFKPEIIVDNSYTSGPVSMLLGHDGSLTKCFGDYRDQILLEFEKRIYNNIKVNYDATIFDIRAIVPGAFRNDRYKLSDFNDIIRKDFIEWAGAFNVNYSLNNSFDESNPFTYNFKSTVDTLFLTPMTGSWRAIYKYFYDTDRPHTHPWEMLGLDEKPSWWETEYGAAPYTSSNTLLWTDLQNGYVRGENVIKDQYIRSSLLSIIPVDGSGNLLTPDQFLVSESSLFDKQQSWNFGDHGPAETAWRRSSFYPFAVNAAAALLDPCNYTSKLFDVSRISINALEQVLYADNLYLTPSLLVLDDGDNQSAGYGNFVLERGKIKDSNYPTKLKNDVDYVTFNLFYKVGGFTSKDKIKLVIDTLDPASYSQGSILPPESYSLILNKSNPIDSFRISGIVIQKYNGKFLVKGYDKVRPYFEILPVIRTSSPRTVTVGGISESFTDWVNLDADTKVGISTVDTTTAQTNTSRYYKQGQIVRYNGLFYRVKTGHSASEIFDASLFQQLPKLPIKGGVTVEVPTSFNPRSVKIPYGTEYSTIQEVYDLILSYGAWLESQGFIFDQYDNELFEVLDWKFSAKEFLFWTTQNWSNNNLITISPFAKSIKFSYANSIVDNINPNYDYSLLKADGKFLPKENVKITRDDGVCTIETLNTEEGLFFAVLNLIQKEHAMIFENTTLFNDIIYDVETGYRQRRFKISGFRTANWNGDLFSPGFIYDEVNIQDWQSFTEYLPGAVVRFNSEYYESISRVRPSQVFNFTEWVKLNDKPIPDLLPNFSYKINQFDDFYSLDIDNFDIEQQKLAQHLIGYSERPYLTNIFTNPTTQYKFYQGYIREKGTRNAFDKISKAGSYARKGDISFNEEWAIRVGSYGSFETFEEVEFTLNEGTSLENPYIVKFTDSLPVEKNSLINYSSSTNILIKPKNFDINNIFNTIEVDEYSEDLLKLSTAGYVRPDDVTVTAYNKNSLLDIANNSLIQEKNTVWVGFLENGSWDVYRYTKKTAKISGVFVSAPAEEITFVSDSFHNLAVGDVVSVVNFNEQVNGIHIVKSVPKLNQFAVASELSTIVDDDLIELGSLFKFESVRFNNFEDLLTFKELYTLDNGEKFWIDNADNNKWAVYEKIKNYNKGVSYNSLAFPPSQELGHTIFTKDNYLAVLISSPSWNNPTFSSQGRIWVYNKRGKNLDKQFEYILNSNNKTYCNTSTTQFGFSLNYDNNKKFIFAGAPAASDIVSSDIGNVSFSTGTGVSKGFISEGLIKISQQRSTIEEEETVAVLVSPYSYADTSDKAEYLRFGNSIYLNSVAKTTSTLMLVGAPGDGVVNTSTGYVFAYFVNTATTGIEILEHTSGISLTSSISLSSKSKWGEKIVGDDTGNFIAVTAPGFTTTNKTGLVEIFNNELSSKQVIYSPFEENVLFGNDVFVSPSGKFLFVSSIDATNDDNSFGKIAIYTATNLTSTGTYVLRQVIENPSITTDLKFGVSISLNAAENILVVGSLGKNRTKEYVFDDVDNTTFDQNSTKFISPIDDAGTVYIFNNLGDYFVQSEELNDESILDGSRFGFDVAATNDYILVGAPWVKNSNADDDSTFYQFTTIDNTSLSWKKITSQPNLVETSKIKKIALIDTVKEEVIEYLDLFDPVKGKIPGIAEQELKYKAVFDPAIYSIGTALTSVNANSSWIDEHVGELWWDLSTVKYTWYEQSDEIYRKNNWGRVFPGSTIDVYEWVKTDLLPSEWAVQADTNDGLTKGISGQPKYPDNSVLSVKQVFNNVTNSFENVYYYWVKNKVIVPESVDRRISSLQVANIISDPAANGIRFAEILSENAIAFANVQPILVNDRINANISFDLINNKIPRHTEWLLLEEGNASSVPNTLLTKKLFDSLLGHDSLGNSVPDLSLSYRNRYGISIRPRQSMFKDRSEALRNLIEFSNSVLIKNKITGFYSLDNLNKQEDIPDALSREYDIVVEDIDQLALIDTSKFEQAKISCSTFNGKIISVSIINPGFGYALPPKVTINSSTGSDAEIQTEIDQNGRVVNLVISNPGKNYVENFPEIIVRPHTVIVETNRDYGNRWTQHIFNYKFNEWLRIKTQSYNTLLYWQFVDWQDDSYDGYRDYRYVINDPTELATIVSIETEEYIKINNIGDGRYVIIKKLPENEIGDFALDYKIVYSQRGTIQLLDSIWNYNESNFAYDIATYEETLYDQIPDLELFYILTALKDDLFVRDLKVNWNLFFFKAIRYALTEQKLLDWAFKTSFISVTNQIGELDQRSTYTLDNESFFEEYVKEIKPYRTKIRSYTSKYTLTDETAGSSITDFDLPAYFNTLSNDYALVGLSDDLITSYPWKWWADNYKYYVKSILVSDNGKGYTQNPTVVITSAPGDTGSGATAEAYIRNGGVYKILVSNPGSGYIVPPEVHLIGGGPNVTVPAKVSIELSNDFIRKNILSVKFDRTGSSNEFSYSPVTEIFECPGNTNRFKLLWLAEPNKANIVPLLDGKIVFSTEYTIEYFTENVNNYTRQYCEFVFLNAVPEAGQTFKISYHKNISLYQATDRITNFYQPTDDMVGNEIPLLMSGAEYQNTVLQGLSFSYSPPWNQGYFDNNSVWADLVDYYAHAKLVQNADYSTSTLFLDSVDGIRINQKILLTNTSTAYLRNDTVVTAVNSSTNSVTISNREYTIKRIVSDSTSTQGNIVFFTDKKFNKDIPVGAIAEISGVDTGSITGFDGQYFITNSGSDRFTAVGTGSHASSILSTSTVKISGTNAKVFVPSVFNQIDVSSVYKILDFTDNVTSTSTAFYDTQLLNSDVSNVEIYLNGSVTPLGTALVPAEYYATTSTNSGTFAFEIYNLGILTNNLLDVKVYGYPKLEFWKDNFSFTGLDTELEAGSWDSAGNFVGALGVDPTDIIVRGGGLVDQNVGHSPEEHVKGSTFESVGISVFTQENSSSPVAMAGAIPIIKNQVSSTTIGIPLEEAVSITVTFKGKMFDRIYDVTLVNDEVDETIFTSSSQFFVLKDKLYIAPQTTSGKAGYNILTISGEYVADTVTVLTSNNQTTATLISSAKFDDIRSAYVTIDGEEVPLLSSPTSLGYEIIPAGTKNNRAAIVVYNISGSKRTVQAWFLKSNFAKFNGMWTEYFNVDPSTSTITLSRLPGTIEPLSSQAFVEVLELAVTDTEIEGRRRLNPPDVVYYVIKNNQTTFLIDNIVRPSGTYTISNTRVYSNGQLLAPGFDYTLDSGAGTITLQTGLLPNGTNLAIETLTNFDYVINGNSLILTNSLTTATTIKVTSFSSHDGMMLRTERFTGDAKLRFTLGLPVANTRFIWANINKEQLVSGYDFELLSDHRTVQFNDWINMNPSDEITISYVSTPLTPNLVYAYKIFQDIFNRVSYSRISNFYSTRLRQDLTITDTEIYVDDSMNLIPPNSHRNLPGVVYIDGERIEFFTKDNNILGDLRRSTMGTAPAALSLAGTKVLDQSLQQFVPYTDIIKKQYHMTTENTGTYVINTVTNVNNTYTVVLSSVDFLVNTGTVYQTGGNGITITNDQYMNDQIFVKFGGRPLRKNSIVIHDTEIAYDSTSTSLKTVDPEFVVRYNNVTGNFELDITVHDFRPATKIEIEQKVGTFWQTSTSILLADTVQANFIRQKTAELPDSWYYGGDS